ncbi:MAG: hypothetical protein RL318_2451 [Fibrobacterota bacterium]
MSGGTVRNADGLDAGGAEVSIQSSPEADRAVGAVGNGARVPGKESDGAQKSEAESKAKNMVV